MSTPERSPEEVAALREFFDAVSTADKERSVYVNEAPEAMRRLAKAVCGHDNSQAQTVWACLASIYNGQHASRVRLDEIRWLDWSLQKDLIAVMIGTGAAETFNDNDIRKTLLEVGGQSAVDDLHWYTTGGQHRAALRRLVEFIKANRASSSALALLDMLKSFFNGTVKADLSRLGYIDDEHTRDFVLVLDGLVGKDQGNLKSEDIGEALEKAGLF